VGSAANEPLRFQVVDEHGGVGTVGPERRRQVAHRHRLVRDAPDSTGAREAQPDGRGDLAPSLMVEDEV
jgi:hypothetical protein